MQQIFKCMRCGKIVKESELEYKIDKVFSKGNPNIDGTHYCNWNKKLVGYVKLIGHDERR